MTAEADSTIFVGRSLAGREDGVDVVGVGASLGGRRADESEGRESQKAEQAEEKILDGDLSDSLFRLISVSIEGRSPEAGEPLTSPYPIPAD